MKRAVTLGAMMFFLGLAAAPRSTAAQKDEVLTLLCHRFQIAGAPNLSLYNNLTAQARVKGKLGWIPQEAVVTSLETLRNMVCVR